MTRVEVREEVLERLENNSTFHTASDINQSIQNGYDHIAVFTKVIEKEAIVEIEANLTYYDFATLITDFYSVLAIFNESTQRWLDPTTLEKMDAMRIDWELMTGAPRWFFPHSTRHVAIIPRPTVSTGEFLVRYNAKAPTLEEVTTLILPRETEQVIHEYALQECYEQDLEFGKAAMSEKEYQDFLTKTKHFVSRRASPDRVYSLWPSFPAHS